LQGNPATPTKKPDMKISGFFIFSNCNCQIWKSFYTLGASAGVSIASKTVLKTYNMKPVISEMSEAKLMEHVDLLIKSE